MVSAFTATRGTGGEINEPTYYHRRRRELAFHIDHVFVPRQWACGSLMRLGSYDDWVATGQSDHVPLVVDLGVVSERMVGS